MTAPDTSGFYKRDGGTIYYAVTQVTAPDYTINRDDTSATTDGWAYFADQATAMEALDSSHACVWPGDAPVAPTPTPPPPKPVKVVPGRQGN